MTDLLVAAFLYLCLDFIYRVKEEASGAEMAFVFYVLLSDGVFFYMYGVGGVGSCPLIDY
jgi:hypothetical protein